MNRIILSGGILLSYVAAHGGEVSAAWVRTRQSVVYTHRPPRYAVLVRAVCMYTSKFYVSSLAEH